jgi:hypothetical protein
MKFKSKIGPELLIPIAIILTATGILLTYDKTWPGLIVILIVSAFIAHIILTTYYEVTDNILRVKCGVLMDKTIHIDTIKEIKETHDLIASPAVSLDRLRITYNKYQNIIISPKEKNKLIDQLKSINPGIKVTLRGTKDHL